MSLWTIDDLARLIDHTNIHADATEEELAKLCDEAKAYHFKMVAINQAPVKFCSERLLGTDIDTGAAISFPLGQTSIAAKVYETKDALSNGANEIDYVVNLMQVKAGNWDYIENEMAQIVAACQEAREATGLPIPCKVILETCMLTNEEKVKICEIAVRVRPTFVKTSTGCAAGGATVEDVKLMKATVGDAVQVKASGGIRDADTFLNMVRAGATRIGCSAGIPIINELRRRFDEQGIDSIEL